MNTEENNYTEVYQTAALSFVNAFSSKIIIFSSQLNVEWLKWNDLHPSDLTAKKQEAERIHNFQ